MALGWFGKGMWGYIIMFRLSVSVVVTASALMILNLASCVRILGGGGANKLQSFDHCTEFTRAFILLGRTLGTKAAEHKGCNWGMEIDWWLQPRAVFGHTFSGKHISFSYVRFSSFGSVFKKAGRWVMFLSLWRSHGSGVSPRGSVSS